LEEIMFEPKKDLTLQHDVIEELEWEPVVNAEHIGVTARNGVVTLTGHVESFAEKLAAEKAALRVKGVRALAQDIEVELPTSKKTADDEIAARALKILEWDILVPSDRISVKADHGVVTLSGEVDRLYQRDEAERDIWRLSGVRDVVNLVKVRTHIQPANVEDRIRRALERSANIEASHIAASVKDGTVTLHGTVGAWIERETAERAARAAPGVVAVKNEIAIGRP
jgi:osmotically-inducible protein OsmY